MTDRDDLAETLIGDGRPLLIPAALILLGCGGFAIFQAATGHFLPHDSVYLGMTANELCALQDCRILRFIVNLVPLIAHDRAGFGGALVSSGLAMLASVMYGRPSRALWQALAIAGFAGFACAIGIHPVIGYTSVSHLGPAVFGAVMFGAGLALSVRET